ncbi:hypothetical protein EG329_011494 [Mollisiaceae sp. DMI_Dod_QoI]|nr:hypothetical protein EG329_011494 [Helotiales sp. DMI_Dod_QoI]
MAEVTSKKRDQPSSQALESEGPKKKQKVDRPIFSDPILMITLTAGDGDGAKAFLVHKEVACHYSPVLAKAGDRYQLKQFSERAVRFLVQWLYSQQLVVEQLQRDHDEIYTDSVKEEDSALNVAINTIDAIYRKIEDFPTNDSIAHAYQTTTFGDELREFLVAMFVHALENLEYNFDEYLTLPQEFLRDVTLFTCKKLGWRQKSYRVSDFYSTINGTEKRGIGNGEDDEDEEE